MAQHLRGPLVKRLHLLPLDSEDQTLKVHLHALLVARRNQGPNDERWWVFWDGFKDLIEGSLEVKLPTIWTVGKAEVGRVKEEKKWEDQRRKKMQVREKLGQSHFTMFLPMVCGPRGSKSNLLWRKAHVQVKMYKTHHVRTTFGSWDVEKALAVVACSTCACKNAQSTPFPDHFWKLRSRKSARRCGAKHISNSKAFKTDGLGPLLEVEMSKSARRCGAKHVSKSKCTKHDMFGPLFDVQMSKKVHAVVARNTFGSQKCHNLRVSKHFWRSDVEKVHTD